MLLDLYSTQQPVKLSSKEYVDQPNRGAKDQKILTKKHKKITFMIVFLFIFSNEF